MIYHDKEWDMVFIGDELTSKHLAKLKASTFWDEVDEKIRQLNLKSQAEYDKRRIWRVSRTYSRGGQYVVDGEPFIDNDLLDMMCFVPDDGDVYIHDPDSGVI